jgi:hypothetical protein
MWLEVSLLLVLNSLDRQDLILEIIDISGKIRGDDFSFSVHESAGIC